MSDEQYEEQEFLFIRAKNLFLRGRDIILAALEHLYPGFLNNLENNKFSLALDPVKKEDISLLYWAGAGWLGAYSIDPMDMEIGLSVPKAAALMERVLELDEKYGKGSIHDFFITYYGSIPSHMGGDLEKAKHHFEKSLELSRGESTSPYLALATTACIKEQNTKLFRELLRKALKINPDTHPEFRLMTILNQRKARWLLEHIDDFFLINSNEEEIKK